MPAVGIIMAVVAVAGTALSAYGMYQQAQSQKKAQEFNANVNRETAAKIREKAKVDVADQRRDTLRKLRANEMQYAASGIDPTSGSPLQVMRSEAGYAALNRERTLWNAEEQAVHYENTGEMLDFNAQQTGTAGTILAVGTAAQGVGKAYTSAYGATGYASA